MQIIANDDQCPIKPEHINTDRNFMGTIWQNMETEVSANWLVRFAQRRNSWTPFTIEELEAFYHEKRPVDEKFWFNKLTNDGHISEVGDKMTFTIEFVSACYMVSPA